MKKQAEEVKSLKEIGLNEKQQVAVKKYLASRFFQFGVKWWELEYQLTPRSTTSAEFTQDLAVNANNLGIFSHALSRCTFVAKVWITEDGSELPRIGASLRYEHNGGGSNGCAINCSICVNDDGDVIEIYRK